MNQEGTKIGRIEWFLFKMLFRKTGLKKSMQKLDSKKLNDYMEKAISEEKYELAAVLKHYINLKKAKEVPV